MHVAFDPKLIGYLKLREKALKERDARALYQMARIYASMKGKRMKRKPMSYTRVPQHADMPKPNLRWEYAMKKESASNKASEWRLHGIYGRRSAPPAILQTGSIL